MKGGKSSKVRLVQTTRCLHRVQSGPCKKEIRLLVFLTGAPFLSIKKRTHIASVFEPFENSVAAEGQQRKMPCTFDGNGQFALMMRASTGHSAGQNFCSFRNETAQLGDVFVINQVDAVYAEAAYLPAALTATAAVRSVISHGNLPPFQNFP